GREDSLAELESSFNRQVMSGALVADVIEESRTPSVGLSREDSLAQLESSFHRQVNSRDIPTAIVEAPQSVEGGPPPGIMPPLKLDIPQRRRSIAGGYPAAPPSPRTTAPSVASSRRASLPANQGAEPVVVDSLPKRRSSVARPGGGSLVGLQAWSGSNTGSSGMLDDEDDSTTLPASPELLKQSSEMELLETAGTLGVEPVELESGPKKRRSFAVSQSWLEAAAQESAKALEAKKHLEAEKAEAERQQAEREEIGAEVRACLSHLAAQVVHDAAIAEAREQAEQRARAAAVEAERAAAAAVARAEAEIALRLMVESLEREAAVAEARAEAEKLAAEAAEAAALEAAALVKRETEARDAAEARAAEAAEIAEEALRLVAAAEEEARVKEESRREEA
ncbi:unnamed protein product, partial [Hapterophycus canaliculatus]